MSNLELGTAEHAAMITEGRHPGIRMALAWLAFSHLPEPLRVVPRSLYQAAMALLEAVPTDCPELTTALNDLVESKDWAVRALIRHQQGKPGPVPRPVSVVNPPLVPGSVTQPYGGLPRPIHKYDDPEA